MKRFLCLLGLALLGCRPAPRPHTVVMAWESFPLSLDPRLGSDQASGRLLSLTHQGLLRRNARLELVPDACLSWRWTKPYTELAFEFPAPEAAPRFPSGRALGPEDARDSLEALRDPQLSSPKASLFKAEIASMAVEGRTLRVALTGPDPGFAANLCRGVLGIAPAGARGAGLPGTGPYELLNVVAEQRILLRARPQHPDFAGHAHPQDLELRLMPDAATRLLALRHGSAQLALSNLPPDLLGPDPRYTLTRVPGANQEYLAFRCVHPILGDARVRWALSLALDRALLLKALRGGQAREAWSFYPPEHPAGLDAAKALGITSDMDARRREAEALLDAAGFPRKADGLRFTLKLSASLDLEARMKALAIQDQWKRIGVGLELRTEEFGALLTEVMAGRFEVVSLRWVGVPDPEMLYRTFHSSMGPPAGFNRGGFRDAETDRLLEAARQATDPAARLELLKQAQLRLVTQAPYAMLWWPDQVAVAAPGVHLDLNGLGDFSAVWRDE